MLPSYKVFDISLYGFSFNTLIILVSKMHHVCSASIYIFVTYECCICAFCGFKIDGVYINTGPVNEKD